MSPFGPGIKIAVYLALALSLCGDALAAVADAWGIFIFCMLVTAVGVQAVARIWAAERSTTVRAPSTQREWNQLLSDLEETANRVPQQTL